MSERPQVSQRFIQRLAEGVQRPRLIEPVLVARPRLVVFSAPSGYGKTVLAAQIATSGTFADVAWIGSTGESGSVRDALAGLADHLTGSSLQSADQSLPELCHICAEELSALPDGHPLLVVMDDVSWAADHESLVVVERALSEAPVGSTAVVTTRAGTAGGFERERTWSVSTEQLMLTDAEIAQAWQRLARRALGQGMTSEVAAASGRHAALVSLMARQAAFVDGDITGVECTASISSLINELVLGQLSDDDRDLLDYAAALGEAGVDTLKECSRREGAGEGLLRIAAALPLVSVSAAGQRQRFKVHDLVREARCAVKALADRDLDGLSRVIGALSAAGSAAGALEVAIESGVTSLVSACVTKHGSHLLKGSSWEVVRAALDALPAEAVVAEPALLLVRAEADWVQNVKVDAIHQAKLAMRLAELSGDTLVPPAARSLLAAIRVSLADFSGAISDLAPFLEAEESPNANDLADMLYAAIPAYAFLGDRQGLARSEAAALQLVGSSSATGSRLARLELAMGSVAEIMEGDPQGAVVLFAAAAARVDIPQHRRTVALCNTALASLRAGDLEYARRAHDEAVVAGSAFSTPLDRPLMELAETVIIGLEGGRANLLPVMETVMAACEAEGEAFTLAATGAMGAELAVAMGHPEYARGLSERGIRSAAQAGSPVLMWLAELVHAQACLVVGDIERAAATAERILPQVESLQLMGHVLQARFILAQVALYENDLASAVQHLSAMTEHIVEKSPALTVASYLRSFPDMFGPLALAMGVDRIPIRVLNLLNGKYAANALDAAATVLTPAELARLARRMRSEAQRIAEEEKVATDAVCNVRLFGGLQVIAPRGSIADRDWGKRKARLLFAMLASRFGTDVPRGEVIEYLWPDMDEERALNNFYVVWSAMKRALSPESVRETPCPFVEHVHGVCRVVPGRVVSDLDRFTDSLAQARSARTAGDSDAELAALQSIAGLYRGEVLPGDVYDDWFAPLRERFRHDFEDAMLRAAQIYEERGESHEGLSMIRRATAYDPWREDLYQAMLRMQIATGQRSAAIETYFSCRNRLVEDLGIDPSRETTALYEQVLGMEDPPKS